MTSKLAAITMARLKTRKPTTGMMGVSPSVEARSPDANSDWMEARTYHAKAPVVVISHERLAINHAGILRDLIWWPNAQHHRRCRVAAASECMLWLGRMSRMVHESALEPPSESEKSSRAWALTRSMAIHLADFELLQNA